MSENVKNSDTDTSRWRLVTIRSSPEAAEIVSSLLFEFGSTGIVTLEEDIGHVTIGAYFDDQTATEDLDDRLKARLPIGCTGALASIAITEVRDEDWMQKWKEGFEAIHVGQRLVVAPSWKLPEQREGKVVIQIDPGMAFGTGTHETTRLCLEALERYWLGGSLLDVGTGTGILAIAAALLQPGARVVGLDVDPNAVEVAQQNAAINGLSNSVDLLVGQPRDFDGHQFDLVVANLTAEVIVDLTDDLTRCLGLNGVMILSGILNYLAPDVERSLEAVALRIIERSIAGEWAALVAANY